MGFALQNRGELSWDRIVANVELSNIWRILLTWLLNLSRVKLYVFDIDSILKVILLFAIFSHERVGFSPISFIEICISFGRCAPMLILITKTVDHFIDALIFCKSLRIYALIMLNNRWVWIFWKSLINLRSKTALRSSIWVLYIKSNWFNFNLRLK